MDMSNPMVLMDVLMLVSFGYLFLCGVTGKGKLYNVENIHKSKREEYKKTIRILAIIEGVFGIAAAVCVMRKISPWGGVLYIVSLVGILAIGVYCFLVGEQHVSSKLKKEQNAIQDGGSKKEQSAPKNKGSKK